MQVKSVLHEAYKKSPLITIVCPFRFILHCFFMTHNFYTVLTVTMAFLKSLSPGLGICWPSLCEGWGLLCPSQVLGTQNDVSTDIHPLLHKLSCSVLLYCLVFSVSPG